jgi:hypothetical chaperone protein
LVRVLREQTGYELAGDVEDAKINLSRHRTVEKAFPYIDEALRIVFRRERFDAATAELRDKISCSIHECIVQAGLEPGDIDTLFVTGGTSQVPAVRESCVAAVPNAKLVQGDSFGSVGLGLTIEAMGTLKEQ